MPWTWVPFAHIVPLPLFKLTPGDWPVAWLWISASGPTNHWIYEEPLWWQFWLQGKFSLGTPSTIGRSLSWAHPIPWLGNQQRLVNQAHGNSQNLHQQLWSLYETELGPLHVGDSCVPWYVCGVSGSRTRTYPWCISLLLWTHSLW